MNISDSLYLPKTLVDVADSSETLEQFGYHLRDWQHEIQRGDVRSRPELARRIEGTPRQLKEYFEGGDTADATLAAYAEWIADQAAMPRPDWVSDPERVSVDPWFGSPIRAWLLANTPASFRHRNLFTIPEPVFRPRRGRPAVSEEQKKRKARERQKAYRKRVSALLAEARKTDQGRPAPASPQSKSPDLEAGSLSRHVVE